MKLGGWAAVLVLAALGGLEAARGQVPYKEPAPVVRTAVGNTIVADPFPGDEAMAATLVSLKLEKAGWRAAFDELGRQAGVTYTYNLPANWGPPPISLQLERQPYMEALRQLAGQAGIHVHPMPCPSMRPIRGNPMQATMANMPATVWSVSGPFCFVVQSIEHERFLPAKEEPLRINLMLDHEPKMHVLAWPREVEQLEAVDERGHSLVPVPSTEPWARPQPKANNGIPHWADPKSYYLSIALAYPKAEAGKRIAKFKALLPYWIQSRSEMLELDHPATMEAVRREIGGVMVSVGPMTYQSDSWILTLEYKRTTLPQEQWAVRSFALSAVRPTVAVGEGELQWAIERDFKINGDVASRSYNVYASKRAGQVPQPQKVVIAIPLEVRRVLVPVEFKDLPLP